MLCSPLHTFASLRNVWFAAVATSELRVERERENGDGGGWGGRAGKKWVRGVLNRKVMWARMVVMVVQKPCSHAGSGGGLLEGISDESGWIDTPHTLGATHSAHRQGKERAPKEPTTVQGTRVCTIRAVDGALGRSSSRKHSHSDGSTATYFIKTRSSKHSRDVGFLPSWVKHGTTLKGKVGEARQPLASQWSGCMRHAMRDSLLSLPAPSPLLTNARSVSGRLEHLESLAITHSIFHPTSTTQAPPCK